MATPRGTRSVLGSPVPRSKPSGIDYLRQRRPVTPPPATQPRRGTSFTPPPFTSISAPSTMPRRSVSARDHSVLPYSDLVAVADSQRLSGKAPLIGPAAPSTRFTVFVDLDETLVYARGQNTGGRVWLRPGAKEFLETLRGCRPDIDAVVWTAADQEHANHVLQEVECAVPGVFRTVITRDNTEAQWFDVRGYTKDVSLTGRSDGSALLIDNTPDCVRSNAGCSVLVSDFDPTRRDYSAGLMDGAMRGLTELVLELRDFTGGDIRDFLKTSAHVQRRTVPDPKGDLFWDTLGLDKGSFSPPPCGNRDLARGRAAPSTPTPSRSSSLPSHRSTPATSPRTPAADRHTPVERRRPSPVTPPSLEPLTMSPGQALLSQRLAAGDAPSQQLSRSAQDLEWKSLPDGLTTPRGSRPLNDSPPKPDRPTYDRAGFDSAYGAEREWMHIDVGMLVESMDLNGKWWKVQVTSKNANGTFCGTVYDAAQSKWDRIHPANCRPLPLRDTYSSSVARPPPSSLFDSYTLEAVRGYAASARRDSRTRDPHFSRGRSPGLHSRPFRDHQLALAVAVEAP